MTPARGVLPRKPHAVILSAALLAALAAPATSSAQANVRVNDPALDTLRLLEDHSTQSETSIAVHGGTVCAGYVNTRGGDFPSPLAGLSRSDDLGATWTDRGIATPVQNADPVLAVHRATGRFFYASIAGLGSLAPGDNVKSIIGISRSDDACTTFSGLANASPHAASLPVSECAPGTPTACTQNSQCASGQVCTQDVFEDKPWIAIDNSGGATDGNLYACWTEISQVGPGSYTLYFSRSVDAGVTFTDTQVLSGAGDAWPSFCQVAVGPAGQVYVAWGDEVDPGSAVRFRRSLDAGLTFDPPVQVNHVTMRPPGSDRLAFCGSGFRRTLNGDVRALLVPSMAVDTTGGPYDGRIYLAWPSDPSGAADNSDVYLSSSGDGGATWTPEVHVAGASATDQWAPTLAVGGAGTLSIAWYDRRRDPANSAFDLYRALSRDGGVTIDPIRRVTTQSSAVPPINGQATSSGNFDSARGACYMGDYIASTADENAFYYLWGDSRNTTTSIAYLFGRPDPDAYFARLPVTQRPGELAYITNSGDATVSIVDLEAGPAVEVGVIPVGAGPYGVAVSPTGEFVYVANSAAGSVSVIDTTSGAVSDTIAVGGTPIGVAVRADGQRAYVANSASDTVSVIDAQNQAVIASVPVGDAPFGVAVNPAGTRVYVTNSASGTLSVIDTGPNAVLATVPVGARPGGVAVHPSGARVYVTGDGTTGRTVVQVDASNHQVFDEPILSRGPGIVASPDGTRLYGTNQGQNDYFALDVTTAASALLYTAGFGQYEPSGVIRDSFTNSSPRPAFAVGAAMNAAGNLLVLVHEAEGFAGLYDRFVNPLQDMTYLAQYPFAGTSPIGFGPFVRRPSGDLVQAATGQCSLSRPGVGALSGQMVFDDATTSLLGTPVDLHTAVGALDIAATLSGFDGFKGALAMQLSSPTLGFDVAAGFTIGPSGASISGGVANLSGSALPAGPAYSFDAALTYDQAAARYRGPCRVNAFLPRNTPTGTQVRVSGTTAPAQCAPGVAAPIEVTFADVTSPGSTVIAASCRAPAGVPPGFDLRLGTLGAVYFADVATTAAVTGPITVCFRYPSFLSPATGSALRVFHEEGGVLVDRTVIPVDTASRRVCAQVTSLSPFVVGRPVPGGLLPPDAPALTCETGQGKHLGKLATAIGKCTDSTVAKVFAGRAGADRVCEGKARAKFDTAVARLSGCPACSSSERSALRQEVESLADAIGGAAYCAGTQPIDGLDSFATLPPDATVLRCAKRLSGNAQKLTSALLACDDKLVKALARGAAFDRGACVHSARMKFDLRNLVLTTCPACLLANATGIADELEGWVNRTRERIYCAGSAVLP